MKLGTLSVLVIGLLAVGCESAPPSHTQTAKTTQTPQSQQASRPVTPEKNRLWPYLSETKESTGLASNLTGKNFVLVFDGSGSMGDSACGGGRPRILPAKGSGD